MPTTDAMSRSDGHHEMARQDVPQLPTDASNSIPSASSRATGRTALLILGCLFEGDRSMVEQVDFIVIGSGIAGVRAAMELAAVGEVAVLTKSRPDESNTQYAQGGIASALHDDDHPDLHFADTVEAGDGLCDADSVRILVDEGPQRVRELIEWGTAFDRADGALAFTREGGHGRRRILHAGGDSTGQEMNRTLISRIRSMPRARLFRNTLAVDLLLGPDGCEGVTCLDQQSGQIRQLRASSVLLASGGLGACFRDTSNPAVTTGDGFSMALRAGAALTDMEFIQFHPTALKMSGCPPFLLSEALRGEGAVLLNAQGQRFMSHYHPLADLAPRDVVSRAIVEEVSRQQEDVVWLDARHLGAVFMRDRFPTIYKTCLNYGLDISSSPAPVFPAAHYVMGGVLVDAWGRTTLPGLLAAGEVACNGVHGANRLASNSLLEGLVFGARAGRAMLTGQGADWPRLADSERVPITFPRSQSQPGERQFLRGILTREVGLIRSRAGLGRALEQLSGVSFPGHTQEALECESIRLNGCVIAAAALLREETRGGHARLEFPERDDRHWMCHLVVTQSNGGLELRRTQSLAYVKGMSPRTDS